MTQYVKMNQKSNKEYIKLQWKCACGNQDTEQHLLWCQEYEDQREGKDLEEDSDLAGYLYQVWVKRNEKELLKITS